MEISFYSSNQPASSYVLQLIASLPRHGLNRLSLMYAFKTHDRKINCGVCIENFTKEVNSDLCHSMDEP